MFINSKEILRLSSLFLKIKTIGNNKFCCANKIGRKRKIARITTIPDKKKWFIEIILENIICFNF